MRDEDKTNKTFWCNVHLVFGDYLRLHGGFEKYIKLAHLTTENKCKKKKSVNLTVQQNKKYNKW